MRLETAIVITKLLFYLIIVITKLGFPGGSAVKNSPASVTDPGSIPGSGRCPGGGHGNLFRYSCLGNPMDQGALWATVHSVTESDMTEVTWYTHVTKLLSLSCVAKANLVC